MRAVKLLSKVDVGTSQYRICEFASSQRPLRRSIEDFQTRLLSRAENRRSTLEIDKQHPTSSVSPRKPAKRTVDGNIRLSVIGIAHQGEAQTDIKPQKRSNPRLMLRNTSSNFYSQSRTKHVEEPLSAGVLEDQFLLAHSCRVRLLRNSARNRTLYLVLPVEFILNEQNFWQEEEPNDMAVRIWRKLVNLANIVWVVRKEKTLGKLESYCERMSLPLDVVYLLQPKKNRLSLAVNYRPMKQELQIADTSKVVVFGLVETSTPESIQSFQLLQSKLPIIGHRLTYLHLIRAKSETAFGHITDILNKPPTIKIDPSQLLQQYKQYICRWEDEAPIRRNYSSSRRFNVRVMEEDDSLTTQIDTLQRIERLKKEWTDWITKMNALSQRPTQIEGESVPFIVGDMLRRNYPLLDKHYHRETSPRKRALAETEDRKRRSDREPATASTIRKQIAYGLPIFLWTF